jgi:hypothetical protein
MHGLIHKSFATYVSRVHGTETMQDILKEAGFAGKIYLATTAYPDEETIALVQAASKVTGAPLEKILESFGEFIAKDLLEMYKTLVKKEWKTLELLLNTEETIHRVVRLKNPGAQPPKLKFVQTGPNKLTLFYDSPRKLSALAKGIIKGVAKYYGESVSMSERKGPQGGTEIIVSIT